MGQITVKASDILDARPEDVYATIADYRQSHPRIIPKENLSDLQVEQGGYGAGTVIRFKSRFFGVEQSFHQQVSEPEPGRVLVEQNIDPSQPYATTFTVLPVEQRQKSHVEISSTMRTSPGLRGLIERIVLLLALLPTYRKEMKLLEAVARERATTAIAAQQS